ncbi:succinate--CoA ligase subunit alpha [Natranaerofaba carboxydovora]|uniref:succinate--CoA ligase subunit alpha n=1 Tax=Natranaerofaba carboxydovora TaxID=2742683 RepID=UPI001F12ACC2|nr:succinate--CoA ligase subunit alpha [Natranaerofaba carboxydovora]UMZ74088.1 Succinate--CoA ligase [ADP-forming] subunit alpha [Natranaerofaba carboxydovora]
MAILVNADTRLCIQGITGHQGSFHRGQMKDYGTKIVAGVSPGKGGKEVEGVPVFNTVAKAREKTACNASIIFVPAPFCKDAAFEAIDAGIELVVIISEHIPVQDAMEVMAFARERGSTVVGPNTFGVITPGQCKVGIMPNRYYRPGEVGVVARSGTLSYQIVGDMTLNGIGQSTVVGLGGDRVVGCEFIDMLELFEQEPNTRAIVMIGEIGGTREEEAARYIKEKMKKPVFAYIAGKSSPPGKRMGHAGAIIEGNKGTFESKVTALGEAGVQVAEMPWQLIDMLKKEL